MPHSPPAWLHFAPALFVVLWSTGFVAIRLGMPHADPFTFLALRYGALVALLLPVAFLFRSPWMPSLRDAGHAAVAGLLVHAAYLAGCFGAVSRGMPLAAISLIVGLQPVLTALAAGPLLGERLTRGQRAGIVLGFTGVIFVVAGQAGGASSVDSVAVAWGIVGLLGITGGTLYQKRFCGGMPMLTGVLVQYAAALAATLPLALLTEELRVEWVPEFIFALAWHVFVLSIGAIGLLYTMIRHGEASRVSSVFFLTPGVTAIFALLLFAQPLTPPMIAGLAISAAGVALVSRAAKIKA